MTSGTTARQLVLGTLRTQAQGFISSKVMGSLHVTAKALNPAQACATASFQLREIQGLCYNLLALWRGARRRPDAPPLLSTVCRRAAWRHGGGRRSDAALRERDAGAHLASTRERDCS